MFTFYFRILKSERTVRMIENASTYIHIYVGSKIL